MEPFIFFNGICLLYVFWRMPEFSQNMHKNSYHWTLKCNSIMLIFSLCVTCSIFIIHLQVMCTHVTQQNIAHIEITLKSYFTFIIIYIGNNKIVIYHSLKEKRKKEKFNTSNLIVPDSLCYAHTHTYSKKDSDVILLLFNVQLNILLQYRLYAR